MKTYWDTSAVINAFMSEEVRAKLDVGEHVTRLHTFGEFFAHVTGRGIRFVDQGTGENVLMKLTPRTNAQIGCASFPKTCRFAN